MRRNVCDWQILLKDFDVVDALGSLAHSGIE
jgi:hypothetical protein